MNEKSCLCRFISENRDSWETVLRDEYKITVKREGRLAIFNYSFNCDYSIDIVQEARGIIIDCDALEVVCWPFRKFGNHNEYYADEIDWTSARVLEKVDGSIIKLWYDTERDAWQFSTNGMIRADEAEVMGKFSMTFFDAIKSCENYADIPFASLRRDYTYIFELVTPETQVIVSYPKSLIYHIGTRSNITGEELEEDIGIIKPRSYAISSLDECILAAKALNANDGDRIEREGFVVVDKDYRRVKVKSPDYIMMHKLKLPTALSKKECVEILISKESDLHSIIKLNPSLEPVLKYYDYRLSELCEIAEQLTLLAKKLLLEYSNDRGAMARIISKHPLGHIAFRVIDRHVTAKEVLYSMQIEKLIKLIPDYVPADFSSLF